MADPGWSSCVHSNLNVASPGLTCNLAASRSSTSSRMNVWVLKPTSDAARSLQGCPGGGLHQLPVARYRRPERCHGAVIHSVRCKGHEKHEASCRPMGFLEWRYCILHP